MFGNKELCSVGFHSGTYIVVNKCQWIECIYEFKLLSAWSQRLPCYENLCLSVQT